MRADLALIGYGNVGRRFEGLLAERADVLESQHGLTCRVVATSTLRHGPVAGGNPCGGAFDASDLPPLATGHCTGPGAGRLPVHPHCGVWSQ